MNVSVLKKALLLLVLGVFVLAGCQAQTPPTPPPPSPTPTPSPTPVPQPPANGEAPKVTVELAASGLSFDKPTITVPAGASVTVQFNNNESSFVSHNLAVYQDSSATAPIFVGGFIAGGKSTTYQFVAPKTPGNYFFRCDAHALAMKGDFIVTASR